MKWIKNYESQVQIPERDKNTKCFLPICPTLGGQNYLVSMAGGKRQVSHEISQNVLKLTKTQQLLEKT